MSQDLNRFLEAQNKFYSLALSEIKKGRKRSHWMWFVFPQFKGLGFSSTAKLYAIKDIQEAKDYLNHPVLGMRLKEISKELLLLDSNNPTTVLGQPDDLKLKSSMTLFASLENDDDDNVFRTVLEKYFNSELDEKTMALIKK